MLETNEPPPISELLAPTDLHGQASGSEYWVISLRSTMNVLIAKLSLVFT